MTGTTFPSGWADLGHCALPEAARRLALGLAAGLDPMAPAERKLWYGIPALPQRYAIVRRGESAEAPAVAERWTLALLRPTANCEPRWYARKAEPGRARRELSEIAPLRLCAVRLEQWPEDATHLWLDGDALTVLLDRDAYAEARRVLLREIGLRYQGRLVVGSKVIARVPFLDVQPGAVGIVYDVYDRSTAEEGESEGYGVIFGSLCNDGFSPEDVDWMLDITPEVSERHRHYRFRNVASLNREFTDPDEFAVLPASLALVETAAVENPRYAW